MRDKISMVFPTALVAFMVLAAGGFAPPANAEQPLNVRAVRAELKDDKQVMSLIGEIVAREEVGLSFPMGGRLLSISVREGDKITVGQELARLESVQQEQVLLSVEAALEAARAELLQAKEEFERQDKFLIRGATTRIRRDEAERRFRISQANVERATADLTRANKTYGDTFLYASSDGIVIDRLADPGAVVTGARPILKVAVGSALDAVFDAPEGGPDTDPTGLAIDLVLLDKPALTFTGSVRKISPLVDPRKGTVQVTLGVNQPPAEASFGDAVRGTFEVVGPPRIILPYGALTAMGETPAVWVIDPATNAVRLSPITIAHYTDGYVIVEEGIAPGDLIAATGTQLLYPGRVVHPKGGE